MPFRHVGENVYPYAKHGLDHELSAEPGVYGTPTFLDNRRATGKVAPAGRVDPASAWMIERYSTA
jgi:hypothetical protein